MALATLTIVEYNWRMSMTALALAWLLLSVPVLLLVVSLCRAGHREDVARHYVDDGAPRP